MSSTLQSSATSEFEKLQASTARPKALALAASALMALTGCATSEKIPEPKGPYTYVRPQSSELNALVKQYDLAKTDDDKKRIANQIIDYTAANCTVTLGISTPQGPMGMLSPITINSKTYKQSFTGINENPRQIVLLDQVTGTKEYVQLSGMNTQGSLYPLSIGVEVAKKHTAGPFFPVRVKQIYDESQTVIPVWAGKTVFEHSNFYAGGETQPAINTVVRGRDLNLHGFNHRTLLQGYREMNKASYSAHNCK